MKNIILLSLVIMVSCNPVKQLERSIAKVERYKKSLGVKPCECPKIDLSYFDNMPPLYGAPRFFDEMAIIDTMWYQRLLDTTYILNLDSSKIIFSTAEYNYNK